MTSTKVTHGHILTATFGEDRDDHCCWRQVKHRLEWSFIDDCNKVETSPKLPRLSESYKRDNEGLKCSVKVVEVKLI